ncbi:hypothetical protein GOPIP_087_02390 [Gordonia polyisoprenivorans NBRC 16320 = JCM 10675]|nr:hypothetical protein CJJ17_22090 [Gordonia polyisoprenivorans]GAB25847.1 hypothetical protein GOPIP_087_02390 [Gordonia polyisoprenivorans NBRC 16320 = JCM 10675]
MVTAKPSAGDRVPWVVARTTRRCDNHDIRRPRRPIRGHDRGDMMAAAKTTDIADEELEPVADETASSARRVVAAYATDADECRMLLSMLGIAPGENA